MTAKPVSLVQVVASMLYVLIYPAMLLGIAGDWRWPQGWAFTVWFVSLSDGTILYLYRNDPALLAERMRKPGTGNQLGWDFWVVVALFFGFLAWFVVMPLDARRFHWSPPFPLWLTGLGGALLLGSAFFLFRPFVENTYLSPLVRHQTERQQQVVTTGVYAIVRHPMYLGATLLFFGTPLLLGSLWGLAIGLALTLLIAGRILGEEKLLRQQLAGYDAYAQKVRYRLIPGLW